MSIKDCIVWLWHVAKGYRLYIALQSLVGTLHVLLIFVGIWATKMLVDLATQGEAGSLRIYVVILVIALLLRTAFSVALSRMATRVSTDFRNTLRRRIFNHVMTSRWSGKHPLHTGDVMNRLGEDVSMVSTQLLTELPVAIITFVEFVFALYFLWMLDNRLVWALVFIMPVALLLSKSYVRRMRCLTAGIRSTGSDIQSHLQEHLQHRVLLRTLEQTNRASSSLKLLQQHLRQLIMRQNDYSLFSGTIVQLGFMTGYLVAFLWGINGLLHGTITFGTLTAFLQLVSRIQRPVVELGKKVPAFTRLLTSVERLQGLLGMETEVKGDPVRLPGVAGIRAANLCFTYPDGKRPILQHFSYDFQPGSLTAVVGETGAGKSTLLRLMLGLLQPDSGSLKFYSGIATAEASPLTRCNLSVVPQGNTLLSGTIRDNLLMGKPAATDAELWQALYTAAADFVGELPEKLDTRCGEKGYGLSEGQAQRIAIARALLRPGSVLLLDEPSSALDNETESVLLERLKSVLHSKTLILITHREGLAALCTHTLRLDRLQA